MKIGFFSEADYVGTPSRKLPNIRTDQAWVCSLNAEHHCVFKLDTVNTKYDIGICIIPKEENRKHQGSFFNTTKRQASMRHPLGCYEEINET